MVKVLIFICCVGVLVAISLTELPFKIWYQNQMGFENQTNLGEPVADLGANMFGLNAFDLTNPVLSSNTKYKSGMHYMNPKLLRLHYAGLFDSTPNDPKLWVNYKTQSWDREKIYQSLKNYKELGLNSELIINIPGFPTWMQQPTKALVNANQRLLDENKLEDFAKLCADLVKIINVEFGFKIKYFELLNEQDIGYYFDPLKNKQKTSIDKLSNIYNLAATAMKKVDGSIQTGGASFARMDSVEPYKQFLSQSGSYLDFLSYHYYATNDKDISDAELFQKPFGFSKFASQIQNELIQQNLNIPVFLTEFNINWSSSSGDTRMQGHKGAVFDAMIHILAIKNGIKGSLSWNERHKIYGKMDLDYNLKISAELYKWQNQHLGQVLYLCEIPKGLCVSGYDPKSGERSILIVNYESFHLPIKLELTSPLLPAKAFILDQSGVSNQTIDSKFVVKNLEPQSIFGLSWKEEV